MSLDLFIKNRKIVCVKSHTYYKDKSVYPEVVIRFSSPEVPALDPESKWSLSKYGLVSSCPFITTRHTHTKLSFFCPHRLHMKSPFPRPMFPLSLSLLAHRVLSLNEFIPNSSCCPILCYRSASCEPWDE